MVPADVTRAGAATSTGPIVFDAYGTLFDPLALAEPLEARFPGRGATLAAVWRTTQLRHTWLRSLMGAWADFDAITRDALDQTLAGAGLAADDELGTDLLAAYRALPAYPDVGPTFTMIPAERPRAILTNGRRATVEATVRNAGLSAALPVVLSVEDVGVYKPAPAVYALVTAHFGGRARDVAFVSGNAWDCAGAAAFGFHVVRIRRSAETEERVGPAPFAVIDDMRELAAVLAASG